MRLPRVLAEAAAAAWRRDEPDGPGEESPRERAVREHAAELALIGPAVSERGRREGEEVVVDLDIPFVGAAVGASR